MNFLIGDGNFNLQCSNISEEYNLFKSHTTAMTTILQETVTSKLTPSHRTTGSVFMESTNKRLTTTTWSGPSTENKMIDGSDQNTDMTSITNTSMVPTSMQTTTVKSESEVYQSTSSTNDIGT